MSMNPALVPGSFFWMFRFSLTPEDLVAPFVGHGELPAGQLALAEDIFAAQGRAGGDGTGQGARQYGVDEAGCLYPLIVAVQHQPADGHPLADGKLPETEERHRRVGAGPLQHGLFAHMLAIVIDQRVGNCSPRWH